MSLTPSSDSAAIYVLAELGAADSRDRLSSDLLHRKKANYGLIRYRIRQQRCCGHLAPALPGVRAQPMPVVGLPKAGMSRGGIEPPTY